MKNNKLILLISTFCLLTFANCKKEADPITPATQPTPTVTLADEMTGIYSGYGEVYSPSGVVKATFVHLEIKKTDATTIEVSSLTNKFETFLIYNLKKDEEGNIIIETPAVELEYELDENRLSFYSIYADQSIVGFEGNN